MRLVRDVGLAEEIAHEALVLALEHWPKDGVPDNPGAWLTATAKNRAIDVLRRQRMTARKHEALARDDSDATPDLAAMVDENVGDDVLRLVLIACHPLLPRESRVALTLRLVAGLETQEIARAFLVPGPTVQQRIVRAKRLLADEQLPFEVPRGDALLERVPSVLEVIYLVFNEGYAATEGDDWMRPELCEDALRLSRVFAELVPHASEAHGLLALLELQSSRQRARTTKDGAPILLLDQDRSSWDRAAIDRGLAALARATAPGPYALQAAIASCHAEAAHPADTDWLRIVALYDALLQLAPSPIVALNRAVAISMAYGPAAAIALVDDLRDEPALASYHLLPSVRGDLLAKLGRKDEARAEFERAADLAKNARERSLLLERAKK